MSWRGAGAVLAAVSALALAAGCGGGDSSGSSSEPDPSAQVAAWTGEITAWANADEGNTPLPVNPEETPAPPPSLVLHNASPDGVAIAGGATTASPLLGANTGLDARSMRRVVCTWFAWYVGGEHPLPAEARFEADFLNYIRINFEEPPSRKQLATAIGLLHKSIAEAQAAGKVASSTATATVCTLPPV
jgi:ABC-type glycerol-3-phosphate transport system substrate-binding protein